MRKVIIFISFIVLILLAGWFYWFQWRPAEIRKRCSNLDFKEIERVLGGKIEITNLPKDGLNKLYRLCLVRNGLKPENLTSNQ